MQLSCSIEKTQIGTEPLFIQKKVGSGNVPLDFRARVHDLRWFYQKLDTNIKIDNIRLSFNSAISRAQFSNAINLILNEVNEYSKILAKVFDKHFEDKAYISDLISTLVQEGAVSKDQSNRLFVLLMVLDGLDMEVNEGGAKLEEGHFTYLQEFIQIINSILQKHHVLAGISDMMAEGHAYRPYFDDAKTGTMTRESRIDVDGFFDCVYAWTSDNSSEAFSPITSTVL
jgi:hypothetical protein